MRVNGYEIGPGADLEGADLPGATLTNCIGDGTVIRTLQTPEYCIGVCDDFIKIAVKDIEPTNELDSLISELRRWKGPGHYGGGGEIKG
jgi:hypothetical protein